MPRGSSILSILSILLLCLLFLLSGCAVFGGYDEHNQQYTDALVQQFCDFDEDLEKVKKGDDVIYRGLNAGLNARSCKDYKISNELFDYAEQSFKDDVELQGVSTQSAKLVGTVLVNDNLVDYEGNLYERIMLNSYKGLNYVSLKDFENARIEFNRALERQRRAKEYFVKQIREVKSDMDNFNKNSSKELQKYTKQNMDMLNKAYDTVMSEFNAQANFTNPYATYLSVVFFFLDKDYLKAADLFREIIAIDPHNNEFKKQNKVFNQYANTTQYKSMQKYVFVVYESGLGVIRDEVKFSLPFPIDDQDVVLIPFALSKLKKRQDSYPYIIVNDQKTTELVNMDDIVATEFKIQLPLYITKSILSTLTKTVINVKIARTNPYLGIASSLLNSATTKADVRSWQGIPARISIAMLPNNGSLNIISDNQNILFPKQKINKNKNTLVIIRSYQPIFPSSISVIQEP